MPDTAGLYRRFGVRVPSLSLRDGWVSVRCFTGAHDDRHPSARINLSSGGFRCFACGARGGILDALQLLGVHDRGEARRIAIDYQILDPPARTRAPSRPSPPPTAPPPRPPPAPSRVERVDWENAGNIGSIRERTWTYTDRDGAPVGRVHRLDLTNGEKRIWQERPDGDRWKAGMDGVRMPLYQLPDVLERAGRGERILVVEGEKAVDALERLGVFATTSPGGAGKWQSEHTLSLAGATVVPVCDCDLPGRQHVHQLACSLADAGVTVTMPYDPNPLRHDGYDIVDELAGVAETVRAVLGDDRVRGRLGEYIRRNIRSLMPATPVALDRWHERARYRAAPDGFAALGCGRCGDERVHRLSCGIAYCPCGAHQVAPP